MTTTNKPPKPPTMWLRQKVTIRQYGHPLKIDGIVETMNVDSGEFMGRFNDNVLHLKPYGNREAQKGSKLVEDQYGVLWEVL